MLSSCQSFPPFVYLSVCLFVVGSETTLYSLYVRIEARDSLVVSGSTIVVSATLYILKNCLVNISMLRYFKSFHSWLLRLCRLSHTVSADQYDALLLTPNVLVVYKIIIYRLSVN